MQLIDWLIVLGLVCFIVSAVLRGRGHVKSVADFLVAGRSVGRNMMALAEGSVWIGAVNIIAVFEMYQFGGFTIVWWGLLTESILIFMAVSGWLVYRYRQTRALTVAQFLDIRYSRQVRLTAATLAWTAGVINFGIFPAVAARFFIYFCELPPEFTIAGITVSTFSAIMVLLLGISLFFVFSGGQITIIVANFYQGVFINVASLVLVVLLFFTAFNWIEIVDALKTAPENASMLDPMRSSGVKDFNYWYFLISIVGTWYCQLSYLGSQACNASAKSAHEYKMSRALGQWRWMSLCFFFLVLVLISYTYIHHPNYTAEAAEINAALDSISTNPEDTIRQQQTMAVSLRHILPSGAMGLMAAIMVAAVISTYDTFLHTWGSIFIQDIVIPLRKKPLTTEGQMRLLKLSILGVGVFVFLFSLLYPQRQSILMYFALINNIWLGGSGAIVVGGLYWRRGTTSAAMVSLLLGASLSVAGVLSVQLWPKFYGEEFPISGQWIFFGTMVACSVAYVTISLMENKVFNLDKMLHRGQYRSPEDGSQEEETFTLLQKVFGICEESTRFDCFTTYMITCWYILQFIVFVIGMILGFTIDISADAWAAFWKIYLIQLFVMFVVSTVWLTCGGLRDVRKMYKILSQQKRDFSDDGRVGHEKE